MSLTKYPGANYNSWTDVSDTDTFMGDLLHAEDWDNASAAQQAAALVTAFRDMKTELDLDITDKLADEATYEATLADLVMAQQYQALHVLRGDMEDLQLSQLNLGNMLSVKLPNDKPQRPRFSTKTIKILKPYLQSPVITLQR